MRQIESQKYNLEIIAGPCSIDATNLQEIFEIADIRTKDGPATYGTRVVGPKSRTGLDPSGEGMGIDWPAIKAQIRNPKDITTPPSVLMAEEIVNTTDLLVATEVMMPEHQLPHYVGRIPKGKLLAWNPSVNQLGWPIYQASQIATEHGWIIGIKNGKALGATLEDANDPEATATQMEKVWEGLTTYAADVDEIILIQRGVDDPEKGKYRNAPVHEAGKRVKKKVKAKNAKTKLYFDPSHIHGPLLRDTIVEETIRAMHMKDDEDFLYDGILIEVGTSTTDTGQHITIFELDTLVKELATFRALRGPESSGTIFTSAALNTV